MSNNIDNFHAQVFANIVDKLANFVHVIRVRELCIESSPENWVGSQVTRRPAQFPRIAGFDHQVVSKLRHGPSTRIRHTSMTVYKDDRGLTNASNRGPVP